MIETRRKLAPDAFVIYYYRPGSSAHVDQRIIISVRTLSKQAGSGGKPMEEKRPQNNIVLVSVFSSYSESRLRSLMVRFPWVIYTCVVVVHTSLLHAVKRVKCSDTVFGTFIIIPYSDDGYISSGVPPGALKIRFTFTIKYYF